MRLMICALKNERALDALIIFSLAVSVPPPFNHCPPASVVACLFHFLLKFVRILITSITDSPKYDFRLLVLLITNL